MCEFMHVCVKEHVCACLCMHVHACVCVRMCLHECKGSHVSRSQRLYNNQSYVTLNVIGK